MPHIVIEHSAELSERINLPALAKALHLSLAEQETVVRKDIKTRTIAVQNTIVGEDSDKDLFIHVVLKLLEGRDEILRGKMAKALYRIISSQIVDIECSVSVDTVEMNKAIYCK